ncbi:MAG TPA: DNA repair protein RecN, partial [Chloroflexota bacterium]|nr:DNA repair protein RecN [Chloroflexota bacterium]
MLTELSIRDFAIIDELRVQFAHGLNVLTGETGAGKSIIVDALGATLGQRVDSDVVRTGANLASAEAVFEVDCGDADGALATLLAEHGLEAEDGLLVLRREINRSSGRTVGRVNGRVVPVSVMQRVGQLLVDIHGQTDHLSLLRVREHVDYLDRYAGLMEQRRRLSEAVRELRAVRDDIEKMTKDERESAREMDLLGYQIQEIGNAGLTADEEERLLSERSRLRNAERLMEAAAQLHVLLSGGDEQVGAIDLLAQAQKQYLELARYDPSQEADREALDTAVFAVEEAAQRARSYAESIENDPARLTEVEERLEVISNLKRKYGRSVAEVLAYCEEAEAKLEKLSNRAFYLDGLREAEHGLLEKVGELAGSVSRQRKATAVRLAEEMHRELRDLNMGGTSFQVSFSVSEDPNGVAYLPVSCHPSALTPTLAQREREHSVASAQQVGGESERVGFDATGIDRVEFLVSPNPGEEPKPLAKIASGGETARLMLALKTILSKADAIPTLVFDEIDVGVGAR